MPDDSPKSRLARELRARCRGDLRENEPLSAHTTFGLGGPADLFFFPADLDDVAAAVPLIKDAGLPVLPLGGGTNTLAGETGFRGLVICLARGATSIRIEPGRGFARAGASLQVFSRRCARAGRTGMEYGCGIPGTVGGAIRGNAGAWGGETLDRLLWLRGVDLETGDERTLLQRDIRFGYRRTDLPPNLLILEAAFGLEDDDPASIRARMDDMLARRKATQPLWNRNAGCIFKNPPGTSAGLLIDRAGCKGLRAGGVAVSEIHANFVVNLGNARADDVLALIDQVREQVFRQTGIELETEIRFVGEHGIENLS